jgi:hypothetical protein
VKIYNEIIIDMNPKSSSYGETLYEDSFEYAEDIMLMQEYDPNASERSVSGGLSPGWKNELQEEGEALKVNGEYYWWNGSSYQKLSEQQVGDKSGFVTMPLIADVAIGEQSEDVGMEEFTSDIYQEKTPNQMADYIFATKYNNEVPGGATDAAAITAFKKEIKDKLTAYAPQLGEPGIKETGFLAEQYGGAIQDDPSTPDIDESRDVSFAESLTGRKAGQQKQQDIYSLQTEAYKATPSIGGTGMGGGIRTQMAGQESIKKGFETTQDQYGLTKDVAEFDYTKGMYGLEEGKEKEWETNFQQFLGSLPTAG